MFADGHRLGVLVFTTVISMINISRIFTSPLFYYLNTVPHLSGPKRVPTLTKMMKADNLETYIVKGIFNFLEILSRSVLIGLFSAI